MALIDETLERSTPHNSTLEAMMRYHFSTGGKRLRALLPLLVAESIGIEPAVLIPYGASCEMLHNATLVHDDLQDGDELRRGQQTVWKQFGGPQAINLGDAMFYYALLLIDRLKLPIALRHAVQQRVLRETLRVIDGQEREFRLKEQHRPSLDAYFEMVEGKTSGLFALPMAGAAVLCGAPTPVVEGLQEAARHMGVLFQIQDDLLDIYGNKGRDIRGSDIREGKRSILVVHALGACPPEQACWLEAVLDKPREETDAQDIAAVVALLENTGSVQVALQQMERRKDLAIKALIHQRPLQSLVEAMCDLFLAPIQHLLQPTAVS
jgi:geranylgeranyl pyrophosphate synthase